ncbi:glycosyltransferase family 61 protein [Waterburya agarophytonicola K14]|uniref:Glycosyltransferase family 61 protein n=1 Tax=Waterburya agarophytonicola KI4 TaxID=2874699 RepID=A0A964FKJ0_9CYAN|nr:glycosyltransferase family 61 protein [Waterburya agarophytonicola]MCC0179234.1 glycosyltransferase family 61 protein [Waterburya agarophytonicola KI4]
MIEYIKNNFKKNQKIRIAYREIYYTYRKLSLVLFKIYLKIIKLKTVSRNNLLTARKKYKLQEFSSAEIISFGNFYTPKPIPPRIAQRIYPMKEKIVQPFVCELEQAEIIGHYPVAFDRSGYLILETTLPIFNSIEAHVAQNVSIKTIIASQFNSKDRKSNIDLACILTNPWSNNFWHWTVDTLTQLEGIEYYQQQTGIKPKLIVESNLRSWQRDSLQLLGYEAEDLIFWQDFRRTITKLVVPSFRRSYDEIHGEISVSACQWLKQKMLGNISNLENKHISFSSKVFVSRRKALGRRIANENEVMEALKPLGFTPYILEEMSYIEQVKLFAQAKVIIAPHGAGLTNLIFADNPIILELFGAYVGREFANLARGMDFKYGCLGCPPPRGEVRQKDGDMMVDVSELLNLLEQMEK